MKFVNITLKMEPNNSQAKELKQLIQRKQNQGQLIGIILIALIDCV